MRRYDVVPGDAYGPDGYDPAEDPYPGRSHLGFRRKLWPWSSPRRCLSAFIVPVSADPSEFALLVPWRRFLRGLKRGSVARVWGFRQCKADATLPLTGRSETWLRKREERAKGRYSALFVGGIGATVLGALNMFIPDPMPFLDEIILMAGGAGTAYLGLYFRRTLLPQIGGWTERMQEKLDDLFLEESPILSAIFNSIEQKHAHRDEQDSLEAESRWIDEIDFRAMADTGSKAFDETFRLFRILGTELGLRRLRRLARGNGGRGLRRRAAYRRRLRREIGLSEDAITVYLEYYERACDYFGTRGISLDDAR